MSVGNQMVLQPRLESDFALFTRAAVVAIQGEEGLSMPYRFTVELETPPEVAVVAEDLFQMPRQRVKLVLRQGSTESLVHGLVMHAEHLGMTRDQKHHFRIVIASELWRAGMNRRTHVFKDKSIPEIVQEVLQRHNISPTLQLQGTYPPLSSVMMYEESDCAFLSRLLEDQGIWYWFKHDGDQESLVLGDHQDVHPPHSEAVAGHLGFEPVSAHTNVLDFRCELALIPRGVLVTDYNPDNPSVAYNNGQLADSSHPHLRADGQARIADHLYSLDRAEFLAHVRAEELSCRQRLFRGESNQSTIRAGCNLDLGGHPLSDFNGEHLVIRVEHRWRRPTAGDSAGELNSYKNFFTTVPFTRLPFRPLRATPVPKIPGFITGAIQDDAGKHEGNVAGSYHVKLLVNESAESENQRLVRMSQPSTGSNYGTHWPLPIGAEVLLGHVNGDPDRPIIAGAVPNIDTNSPVDHANHTQAVWRGAAGNELIFEDEAGAEFISFHATKDWRRNVGANSSTSVGGNSNESVSGKKDVAVTKDTSLDVSDGNLTVTVAKNVTLAATGIVSLHSDEAGTGFTGSAPKISLTANTSLTLTVGSSVIELTPSGITISATTITVNGTDITISGGATVDAHAPAVTVHGSATAAVSSPATTVAGTATLGLSGAAVTLSGDSTATVSAPTVNISGATAVNINN